MKKKFTLTGLLLICVFIMAQMGVEASETLSASHHIVKNDILYAYVENPGEYTEVKCQVGQEYAVNVDIKEITDPDISVNTYILIDNSLSIQEKYRETMKQVAKDIIFSRKSNESFTIATFDTEIHYLVENSQDQEALIGTVEQIEFQDLDTQVTNVLYHLYEKIEDDNENNYKRIILMSDGVETKTIGYTKEELIEKAKENGYPVYILGCTYKSNEAELENMFRISRETGAEYYFLDEIESADQVAASIGNSFDIVRVQLGIPESQQDGALKGIRIIFVSEGNEKISSFEQTMPFLTKSNVQTEGKLFESENTGQLDGLELVTEEVTEIKTEKTTEKMTERTTEKITERTTEKITERTTEKITEKAHEEGNGFPVNIILIIVTIVLLVILIVSAIAIFKKKKNRKSEEEKERERETRGHTGTEIIDESDSGDSDEKSQGDVIIIRLTDVKKPTVITEYSLGSSVILGRISGESEIVFDYEKSVSGQHCKLIKKGEKVYIQDLDSLNGTSVNGKALKEKEKAELITGSIIKMGRLQIKFETVSDVSDEDENKKSKNENSKKPVKPSTGTEGVFDFKEDETDGE